MQKGEVKRRRREATGHDTRARNRRRMMTWGDVDLQGEEELHKERRSVTKISRRMLQTVPRCSLSKCNHRSMTRLISLTIFNNSIRRRDINNKVASSLSGFK